MGVYTQEQISDIIIKNPNKDLMKAARKQHDSLIMHTEGINFKSEIVRDVEMESASIYEVRKKGAVSNKDLFGRLLQEEDIIFMARGGSSNFGLSDADEKEMNVLIENVRYGMSLRKWLQKFGLPAYRTDPMGVIFMEVEQIYDSEDNLQALPKCYPTYKSTHDIHDYDNNGRKLEYICFTLTVQECLDLGITDKDVLGSGNIMPDMNGRTIFYRFVDDAQDAIYKQSNDTILLVTEIKQRNPIPNTWQHVPAFIVSDLINFCDPRTFASPITLIEELAKCYMEDRSIRNLQKKYHGFAKAVEPLLNCSKCGGQGMLNGKPCPECTPAGADKGTGYKVHTKIADVSRFPIEIFETGAAPTFDFKKIFGYVTPDIESWNKQDLSLMDIETAMYYTYWGVMPRSFIQQLGKEKTGQPKTATEIIYAQQPKYTRLNMTADWYERCSNLIADLIGEFWFDGFNEGQSAIVISRNYILQTPEEIYEAYSELCENGAPDSAKDELLERYYHALYRSSPIKLAYALKLMNVIPFPHNSIKDVELSNSISWQDKLMKAYGQEWARTKMDIEIVSGTVQALKDSLTAYITAKNIIAPVAQAMDAVQERITV